MRSLIAVLVLLAAAFSGCLSSQDGGEPRDDVDAGVHVPKPWLENWEITALDLHITVDPEAQRVSGEGTVTIQNPLGARLRHVDLYGGFDITDIRDEAGQALSVAGGNVTLTGDVSPGTVRTLTIAYEGWNSDVLLPGLGADEWSAHYLTAAPYTTGIRNNADNRFAITSPSDWTVLGAAARLDATRDDGQETVWYHNQEPRVIVYAAEGLLSLQETVDDVEVRTWYFPSQRPQGEAMHETAKKIIRHVPQWTGPYPYDHLWTVPHQVAVNAFNTPALNFMGWTFYRPGLEDAPVQFGRDLIPVFGGQNAMENVLVHESVHNWWGQMLRGNNSNADDDGEKDTWMSEGITTYLAETVWFDRLYGEDQARESADHMVRALTQGRTTSGTECGTTEGCGDHYVKGALSMRALEAYGLATDRPDLSLELLQAAMEVHGRHHGGSGLVDTSEMVRTFEATLGEDLSWWWGPWMYGRELADLAITDVTVTTSNVTVRVANLGGAAAPALVEAQTANGATLRAWTFVDAEGTAEAVLPAPAAGDLVVQAFVDPLQHIYEWDETNNSSLLLSTGF